MLSEDHMSVADIVNTPRDEELFPVSSKARASCHGGFLYGSEKSQFLRKETFECQNLTSEVPVEARPEWASGI